uniref:GMP_PDE_delta domain-containing protein n=1 Tax=Macrostomum lignano TaxID=282301 RepID=A0A1I8FAS8_9PLAT
KNTVQLRTNANKYEIEFTRFKLRDLVSVRSCSKFQNRQIRNRIHSRRPGDHQIRMIERHYFRDRLLKSFDFDFWLCYTAFKKHRRAYLRISESNAGGRRRVDSFYFVNDRLS